MQGEDGFFIYSNYMEGDFRKHCFLFDSTVVRLFDRIKESLFMKNVLKAFGIIALVAIIGFSMAACGEDGDDDNNNNNNVNNNGNGNGNGNGGSPSVSYIINGSGTSFTATKNGATVGTANQSISNVISAIQTDANGANVAIQFGNGTAVLDIGSASVSFSNYSGTWGSITLSGKLTSSYSGGDSYTIYILNGVSVTSTADIAWDRATGSSQAILNNGTLTITSGTISGKGPRGIQNAQQGTLIINGGTINGIYNYRGTVTVNNGNIGNTSSDSYGIENTQNGTVTINGGTISSSVVAIYNPSGGTVTITGGTVSGSGNFSSTISNSGTLNISNGTIKTTGSGTDCGAINNASGGTLTITGGRVESTGNSSRTIRNSGTATINGGTVSATGSSSYAIYNFTGGTVTIGTSAVITGSKFGY